MVIFYLKIRLPRNSLTTLKHQRYLNINITYFWWCDIYMFSPLRFFMSNVSVICDSCLAKSCKRSKATHLTWYFFPGFIVKMVLLWWRGRGVSNVLPHWEWQCLPQETIYLIEHYEGRELVLSCYLTRVPSQINPYTYTFVYLFGWYQKFFLFYLSYSCVSVIQPKWHTYWGTFQMKWLQ